VAQNLGTACSIPAHWHEKESPLRTADTAASQPYQANFAQARLANAGAQEASVVVDAYLTASQKVSDRGNHLFAALRARADCQNQVTKRGPGARSDYLAKLSISFHMLAIFPLSRSNAISHCEYFFYRHR